MEDTWRWASWLETSNKRSSCREFWNGSPYLDGTLRSI